MFLHYDIYYIWFYYQWNNWDNLVQPYISSASVLTSMEEIHLACEDAINGLPSRRPVIEMTIPSVLDKTISPPGT